MTVVRMDLPEEDVPPEWAREFAAICDSHRGRLVRWLTSIFGPRDAEDIAQEALARLYVRPGLLEDDADAWPWLSVVARNVGRDMVRHNAFSVAVGHDTLEQVADDARVPDLVVARDDARRLAVALGSISARDRALLILRDVHQASVTDMAEVLDMNVNAVRQQLFRARKRLANAYVALGGERGAGCFALLGLRVREFCRRHGHAFHAFGPASSTVFGSALPAIAAIVGGALFTASAPPVVVAAGTRTQAAGLRDAVHGAGLGTPADQAGGGPAAVARHGGHTDPPPEDPPVLEREEQVGPVRARGVVYRDPLSNEPGSTVFFELYIEDVPVVGYVRVKVSDHQTGGHGPVCGALNCPTAVPTPPAGR